MADAYRALIPYESLDPLTIGASGNYELVSVVPAVANRLRVCVGPMPVALERLVGGQVDGDLTFVAHP